MTLPIPTVGIETGPQYAFDVNTSLTLVDQHDHSPGRGVPITPAGLNINDDLDLQDNNIIALQSAVFTPQNSAITTLYALSAAPGGGTGVNDLYYTDGTGTSIQITKNGIVNVVASSIPGESYAAGTFTWTQTQDVLPTTPANFDIGSITIRPNTAGTTNGVTVNPPGAIASAYDIDLPLLPASTSFMAISNSGVMTTPVTLASYNASLPDNAGAQSYFLRQAASGSPTWQTTLSTIQTKTTTYAATAVDDVILCSSSSFTVTLPTAVGIAGKVIVLRKTDASLTNIITIDGNSTETIDGNLSVTLNTQNEEYTLYSDGSNWNIQFHKTNTPVMISNTVTLSTGAVFVGVNPTSSFSSGVSSIVVSSATNIVVGMLVTDTTTPANISDNTYVTTVVGTTIGLSNPTAGIGTTDTIHFAPLTKWTAYREGRFLVSQLNIQSNAAGTAGSGEYRITMPFGLTISSEQQMYNGSTPVLVRDKAAMFSNASVGTASSQFEIDGIFSAYDSTTIRIVGARYDNNGVNPVITSNIVWSSSSLALNNSGVNINGWFKVPISGWYP